MRTATTKFLFHCSDAAKEMLLREGIDHRYGARHLKRSIERLLVQPLANLIATGQVGFADSVYVELDTSDKLMFSKRSDPALFGKLQSVLEETERAAPIAAAATPQLANATTAGKSSELGGFGGCFLI